MASRKPVEKEIAAPGTPGHLTAHAHVDDHHVDVAGAYYYVGRLGNGMLAFATAEPIYLDPGEINGFDLQRRPLQPAFPPS